MLVLFHCSWICLEMLPLTAPSKGGTSERLIKNPASVLQPAYLFSENDCPLRKLCREQALEGYGLGRDRENGAGPRSSV